MGGPSSEHAISLASGAQVLNVIESPLPVVIGKDGRWSFDGEAPIGLPEALQRLKNDAELAFLALHGRFGEDGTVQALMEAISLPYSGSGVMASSLAMDKSRSRLVFQAVGLETAKGLSFAPGSPEAEVIAKVQAELGFPVVLKPSNEGSSYGVHFVERAEDLPAILNSLTKEHLLIESRLVGRELTAGVLDGPEGPKALPVTEILVQGDYPFFNTEAKYKPGATLEVSPAEIPDALRDEVQSRAIRAHLALGCRDLSRSDFIVDGGIPKILETNTLPGLTAGSLVPGAAKAANLSFADLISGIIERVRARNQALS